MEQQVTTMCNHDMIVLQNDGNTIIAVNRYGKIRKYRNGDVVVYHDDNVKESVESSIFQNASMILQDSTLVRWTPEIGDSYYNGLHRKSLVRHDCDNDYDYAESLGMIFSNVISYNIIMAQSFSDTIKSSPLVLATNVHNPAVEQSITNMFGGSAIIDYGITDDVKNIIRQRSYTSTRMILRYIPTVYEGGKDYKSMSMQKLMEIFDYAIANSIEVMVLHNFIDDIDSINNVLKVHCQQHCPNNIRFMTDESDKSYKDIISIIQ